MRGRGGSSPLSRGIPLSRRHESARLRIIPALAGNTDIDSIDDQSPRDHPRSRGEYEDPGARYSTRVGSSPLSRGILHPRPRGNRPLGIIPALAGNTISLDVIRKCPRDHPRSRGEYCHLMNGINVIRGSSPLSRGIQSRGLRVDLSLRIIPALAGNTPSTPPTRTPPQDHPRSRGEYSGRSLRRTRQVGSSPLSRGIR